MDYEIWVGGLAPDVHNKNFCEFLQQLDVKPTKVCLTVKMFEKITNVLAGGNCASGAACFLFFDLRRSSQCGDSSSPRRNCAL